MHAPGAAQLLEVWGGGAGLDPLRQALLLLAAAVPDTSVEELAQWPLGTRDSQLLSFRAELFGPELEAMAQCPGCAADVEFAVAVSDLTAAQAQPAALPVTHSKYQAVLRPVTSRDLMELESAAFTGQVSGAAARQEAALTVLCLDKVQRDGRPVAAADLPPTVLAAWGEELARSDPGAVTELSMSCPDCGTAWLAPLNVPAYVWTELHHWARRLLLDVHALARAYGWSERDILALPPHRRQAYLELVRS